MADRLTIEHYIGEAFVKCGQVILGSRILPNGSVQQQTRSARHKRAGRWFLLELDDADGAGKEVELWRKDVSSPLVIEIYMAPGGGVAALTAAAATAAAAGAAAASAGGGQIGAAAPPPQAPFFQQAAAAAGGVSSLSGASELLLQQSSPLERWTLQYERSPPPGNSSTMAGGAGSMSSSGVSSSGTRTYLDEVSVYKRLTILVRSLYSFTRILPAYKLFRAAKRYAGEQFRLQYRIGRTLQQHQIAGSCVAGGGPLPSLPARLQDFAFAPVDTIGGRFRVAVQYNPAAVAALVLEHSTAVPMAMPYTLNENYLGPGGAPAAAAGAAAAATVVAGSPGTGLSGPRGPHTSPFPGAGTPPSACSGVAARHSRPTLSTCLSGPTTAVLLGRSPPADGGILRHAPSAGSFGVGGAVQGQPLGAAAAGGSGGGTPPSIPPAPRAIVRQSWSSKEMKVCFSLPPPFDNPGGPLGLGGGGGAGASRRSSSGYGSTPPLPSPLNSGRSGVAGASSVGSSAAPLTPVAGCYSHQRPPPYQHSQNHQSGQLPHSHPPQTQQAHHRYGSSGSGDSSQFSRTPPRPSSGTVGGGSRAGVGGGASAAASAASVAVTTATSPGETRVLVSSPVLTSAFAAPSLQHKLAAFVSGQEGGGSTAVAVAAIGEGAGPGSEAARGDAAAAAAAAAAPAGAETAAAGHAASRVVPALPAAADAHVAASAGCDGTFMEGNGGGCGATAAAPAAAAAPEAGGTGSGTTSRTTSAPLTIPSRSSSRTRSVVDLRAPAVYGGFEVHPAVAAAAASSRTAASAAVAAAAAGLLGSQDCAADTSAAAGAAAGAVQHRMAPGSAPAAPRGMLGLALGALKPVTNGLGGGGDGGGTATAASPRHPDAAGLAGTSGDTGNTAVGGKACDAAADERGVGGSSHVGGGCGTVGAHGTGPPAVASGMSADATVSPSPGAIAAAAGSAKAAAAAATNSAAGSQALAVVPSPNHHLHPYYCHHHRHASMPYSNVPGSSPPWGRPLPLPVPVGSLPAHGSPQLPFAFTPSLQSMSLASLHQAMVPLGAYFLGSHTGGGLSGGGPRLVSGRDITCLATIRRPSWSSRSGSLDPSMASIGAVGHLMPSLSPLHGLLESSYSNPSTPGALHACPDSSDQPHRPARRHRNPSSSSASAIFSLSPSSAVPGTSPSAHLHHHQQGQLLQLQQQQQQRRTTIMKAAAAPPAATAEVAKGDADDGNGSGGGDGNGKDRAVTGSRPGKGSEVQGTGGAAAAGSCAGNAVDVAGDSGASGAGVGGVGGVTAASTEGEDDLVLQLRSIEPTEDAVQYDLYGDPDGDPGMCPLTREDSESDLLPFALDQEGLVLSPGEGFPGAHIGAAAAMLTAARATDLAGRVPPAGPIELTLSIAQARERDVAVGAFVRLMADAAPLAGSPSHPASRELTPREALAELERLGTRIRAALEAAGPQLAAAAAPPPLQPPQQQHWAAHWSPVVPELPLAAAAAAQPPRQPPQQHPPQQLRPHPYFSCS